MQRHKQHIRRKTQNEDKKNVKTQQRKLKMPTKKPGVNPSGRKG